MTPTSRGPRWRAALWRVLVTALGPRSALTRALTTLAEARRCEGPRCPDRGWWPSDSYVRDDLSLLLAWLRHERPAACDEQPARSHAGAETAWPGWREARCRPQAHRRPRRPA